MKKSRAVSHKTENTQNKNPEARQSQSRPRQKPGLKPRGKDGRHNAPAHQEAKGDIKEFQAHHNEVERQNEELRAAQKIIEESRKKYTDLYDFAPIGYITIDKNSLILELNLTGAEQLAARRNALIQKPFTTFIFREDQDLFFLHCAEVFERKTRCTCEIRIQREDKSLFYAQLISIALPDSQGNYNTIRTAIINITERMLAEEGLHDTLNISRQREAEIAALLKGSRAILENRNFTDTARALFDSCKNLIGAAAGYVALLSADGSENEVLFLDSGGLPCAVDPDLPMPVRGLRAEAYRSGKTVYHNDFSQSGWTDFIPEGHVALKNVLFAPLVIEDNIVGVLGLANKPEGFTKNDVHMAHAFSELASIALRNSRNLESLEISEHRFRSVAETALDAIISIDSRGYIVFWNRGAEHIFGYPPVEMIGRPITMIIPDGLRAAHSQGMQRSVSAGKSKLIGETAEITGLRKNGSTFPLELSVAQWHTREGLFFTGIIRDISERKQVEDELRRHRVQLMEMVSERTAELQSLNRELEQEIAQHKRTETQVRLMALFTELNPSPVLRFDRAGMVLMANPAAMEVFNIAPLAEPLLPLLLPGIEELDLPGCIDNGSILSHSAGVGNRFFHFIIKGLPELGFGQIYGSDITEKKKAEAETLRASHLASLGELAAGVAHEINNPINGIINYTQIIANRSSPGSKENDIANRIMKEGDRIAGIVKCLLSFARNSTEEKHPVHIIDILSDTLSLTETHMRKDGITLRINIHADLPRIFARPEQIEQVFLNLISNARYALNQKFSGIDSEKILHITGEKITLKGTSFVRIIFYDTGNGISKNIIDRVMHPFVSSKPSGMGTGLGLSISHGIVTDHGGSISIDSVEGEFTKVIIEMPATGIKNNTPN